MNRNEPERQGNRDPWMAPHGVFQTQGDDEWISIACEDEAGWQSLCEELAPELASDDRFDDLQARKQNEAALEEVITAHTRRRERWELTRALQARGIAAFPAQSSKDLAADPQLEARAFFERLPHPEVGTQTHAGIPYRLRKRENGVRSAAPVLGADTEDVLIDTLGLTPEAVRELRDAKVLY